MKTLVGSSTDIINVTREGKVVIKDYTKEFNRIDLPNITDSIWDIEMFNSLCPQQTEVYGCHMAFAM
jgi:hypothetical protein